MAKLLMYRPEKQSDRFHLGACVIASKTPGQNMLIVQESDCKTKSMCAWVQHNKDDESDLMEFEWFENSDLCLFSDLIFGLDMGNSDVKMIGKKDS